MRLIEVAPGVTIHVQDLGCGRPVVLLAGFGLDHEAWDREVRELAAGGFRVVAVDLRGTGRSAKPLHGYEMDRLAGDVACVLDVLDLERVTVVGWSFGGQVALRLSTLAPDRLAQLVLLCSNGVRASASETFPFGREPAKLEAALVEAEKTNRIAMRRSSISSAFHKKPDPLVVDWLLGIQMRMPSWSAIACYRTYLHTDLTAELTRLTIPVLQIMGENDPVSSIDGALWLQTQLRDARLVTLSGCGHYPMHESPDAFTESLLSFLAEPDE
jgi:non-heme chloroperoxidase